MNRNSLYAFYGTLRRGMENYRAYEAGMHYLRTVQLSGYYLISLGEYPYAVSTTDSSRTITAELFRLDPEVADSINSMELDAGYYYDEIEIDESLYGIYLFRQINPADEEIPSGDWVEHIGRKAF